MVLYVDSEIKQYFHPQTHTFPKTSPPKKNNNPKTTKKQLTVKQMLKLNISRNIHTTKPKWNGNKKKMVFAMERTQLMQTNINHNSPPPPTSLKRLLREKWQTHESWQSAWIHRLAPQHHYLASQTLFLKAHNQSDKRRQPLKETEKKRRERDRDRERAIQTTMAKRSQQGV